MNFLRQGFRKLSSDRQTHIHTYIQTDRQTDETEIIYHAPSRVVNKNAPMVTRSISGCRSTLHTHTHTRDDKHSIGDDYVNTSIQRESRLNGHRSSTEGGQ